MNKRDVILMICLVFFASNQLLLGQNMQKNVPIEDKTTAVDKEKEKEQKSIASMIGDTFVKNTISSGIHQNKVMLFGGMHNHLYGYTDERYNEIDQGDYCKTNAYWGGLEFYLTDFSAQHPKLADVRFGGNVAYYYQKEYKQKVLYDVPLHFIDEETVPDDLAAISRFSVIPGIFIGIDKKWFGIDAGISFFLEGYEEKYREKLDPASDPGDPTYKKVDGRGYIWGDNSIKMNYLVRLGLENNAHFIISAFREDYNPDYGDTQIKLVFPILTFFQLSIGGYIYKTQSIFIEPALTLFGVTVGGKAGSIINYHDDDFEKVGIKDGLFYSAYISYGWK